MAQGNGTLPGELDPREVGIIVVDHGSMRAESNEMLLEVARMFQRVTGYAIVEAAHMELAEPSIATAFDRCVARGAKVVVCHPYFLLPGRHWDQDIPQLTEQAATKHPGVKWLVTAPLGLHEMMARIMDERIRHCLSRVHGQAEECPSCAGTGRCRLQESVGASA
jgi:sirohydrochlorin ferrochelatase